jgi:4-oxalocrotonate tautomerase
MPVLHVEMLEGRSASQKRELARTLSEEMAKIVGVKVDDIWVIITEVSRERWAVGGKLISDATRSG